MSGKDESLPEHHVRYGPEGFPETPSRSGGIPTAPFRGADEVSEPRCDTAGGADSEGAQLRKEVGVQARQLIAQGERDAAALLDQVRVEAKRARERATSEAERVKAAIIDHTYEEAQSDRVRLRAEAVQEAEELRATMLDQARTDAERIRSDAAREKQVLLEEAEDEVTRLHLEAAAQLGRFPSDVSDVKLLRANEIGSRDFPEARRGFDAPSVRKWLEVIQTSYMVLEQELHRARREWRRALDILEANRVSLHPDGVDQPCLHMVLDEQLRPARAEWAESENVISATKPHSDDDDLVSLLARASHLQSRLDKRLYGYSCSQVGGLLDTLTIGAGAAGAPGRHPHSGERGHASAVAGPAVERGRGTPDRLRLRPADAGGCLSAAGDAPLVERFEIVIGRRRPWPLPSGRMTTMTPATGYERCTEVAGPLMPPEDGSVTVRFRPVMTGRKRLTLAAIIVGNALVTLGFVFWLLQPSHFPLAQGEPWSLTRGAGVLAYITLITLEVIRTAQNGVLWAFAARMRDPVPTVPETGLRVAVLTTVVPSKEPLDVVTNTLRAMRKIKYDGLVDVWILDEGDDPRVKHMAEQLGVRHFSRKGKPQYNQPAGPFKAKTKAGNHNAWRAEHEGEYDIVAQMDPDHRPFPDFLIRTLGYFRDPDVAFVVAPQVYGNGHESFVARASADQSYVFHAVVQRGANGYGAPLLIGTNHLYRPEAWEQIGGYQDSVIEDHLTSLTIHGTHNPSTGQRWKGVYTPDVLAVGEGPATFTDYFNQQMRWAHGILRVAMGHSGSLLPRLTLGQRFSYVALQSFYPSVGGMWVLGGVITLLYLVFGVNAIFIATASWVALWSSTVLGQFFLIAWLRQFNLAEHERSSMGLVGMALSMFTGPIYVAAAFSALCSRSLQYVVTAKGALASRDSWSTFRLHVLFFVTAVTALVVSAFAGHSYWVLRFWAILVAVAAGMPVLMFWRAHQRQQRLLWAARGRTLSRAYFAPLGSMGVREARRGSG